MGFMPVSRILAVVISSDSSHGSARNQRRHLVLNSKGGATPARIPIVRLTGANQLQSPTNWVIAFSTTGDRIVLQSHSPQPRKLVLK